MRALRIVSVVLLSAVLWMPGNGQTRIDSSFAFGGNPAKKYSLYIPSAYNASNANELMLAFHPFNTSVWDAQSWCDSLVDFAESNDLIVVCPDGDSDGRVTDSVDYAFTEALMDSMKLWYNVDVRRTYCFGFSWGGRAVYEYGLNHASDFGGFMSLGVASGGWSISSLNLNKASWRAFYLLQGANDPNNAFGTLYTALENNCAMVDSQSIAGVGHTFTFLNRDQYLTTAYDWIDSVNFAPQSGVFSLVSPANFTDIDIRGFRDFEHYLKWTPSSIADTCAGLTYEVMFDLVNQNFANPIITFPSASNGLDTFAILENYPIDTFLANLGVPLGGFTDLKWTVRSVINGIWSDTAKSFQIRIYRKRLGYDLISPSDDIVVTLERGSNSTFDWQDLLHYSGLNYYLLFSDTGASLVFPKIEYLSNNLGLNSVKGISHLQLYYDFMFKDEVAIGDTVMADWAARADDTVYTALSDSYRRITFIRGDVGFRVRTPVDSSIMTSRADIDYVFTWDSVSLDSISYIWYFDTVGVDVMDTAAVIDTVGPEARLDVPFETLDSLMNYYNVDYLDTIRANWTVKAFYPGGEQYAMNILSCIIVRAHPLGISENALDDEVLVFPNPAKSVLNVFIEHKDVQKLLVTDINGKRIYELDQMPNRKAIEIDVSSWPSGAYLLHIWSTEDSFSRQIIIE